MGTLANIARMATATTGTGTVTLGSAVSGFLTFAQAGITNGQTVSYAIEDGANREVGQGVYSSSGPTLTRVVSKSTNSNAAISLSGTAQVFIAVLAEDLALLLTSAERTKLTGIEALADVTDIANVGAAVHGATAKTTPIDADEILVLDSAASFAGKRSTWTNVKAFLKTYFDTLYQPLASKLTTLAGQTWAADTISYQTSTSALSTTALTSTGRTLIGGANAGAMRTTLGLVIGTDVQAYDVDTAKTDVAQTFTLPQRVSFTTLTYGGTVTPDLANNNGFVLTMSGNPTMANPSNIASAIGQEVLFVFRGAFQPSFGSFYKFPGGTAPTFSGSLNAIGGTVISSTEILVHGVAGYA